MLEFLGSRSKSSPDFLHQLLDVDLFIVERLLNSRSGGDPVVNPGMSGRFPRCGHFSRSLHYVEKERGSSLTSLFPQFCPPLPTHCPLALILFSMEGTVIQPPLLCRTCPHPAPSQLYCRYSVLLARLTYWTDNNVPEDAYCIVDTHFAVQAEGFQQTTFDKLALP